MASISTKPKRYNFKSSGKDSSSFLAKKEDFDSLELPPLGIKTPLELAYQPNDSLFVCHRELQDVIKDNFRNLLLTNKGERLGRPDFGCSLRNLTFEIMNSDEFENLVMTEIESGVKKYIPYVELKSFSHNNFNYSNKTVNSDESTTLLQIDIVYDVPLLGLIEEKMIINLLICG